MAARTPTGKPRTGEQKNQDIFRTGVTTFTGTKIINPGLTTKRGSVRNTSPTYVVTSLVFEDVGGAAAEEAQRLSSKQNTDGTFTIYAEEANFGGSNWAQANGACTVRWTIMITG